MVAGLQLQCPDKNVSPSLHILDWMKRTPYCELVGSLNYLAVATHPDISFAVGHLSSFLDCYRQEHWQAAIHVLRYIKGTHTLSLSLGGSSPPCLVGYSDLDFTNCLDTSRSISGYCFSLGSGTISWSSKQQKHAANSFCYAEYIALHHASKELLFLRSLLDDLGYAYSSSTLLHCDNDAAHLLTEDPLNYANVKHFQVKYHII